jgi:hypothetical protein
MLVSQAATLRAVWPTCFTNVSPFVQRLAADFAVKLSLSDESVTY